MSIRTHVPMYLPNYIIVNHDAQELKWNVFFLWLCDNSCVQAAGERALEKPCRGLRPLNPRAENTSKIGFYLGPPIHNEKQEIME